MWKPFRTVANERCRKRRSLFDKFHVLLGHLGEALDRVRKSEYARLTGKARRHIKGRNTPASRTAIIFSRRPQGLKALLAANKRLNTAYLLKESFAQLWGYEREGWARRFFENWKESLKRQRLASYDKFADMIDRHWDGIAAYCKPENKVSLGFVEGLNNKIRQPSSAARMDCATRSTCGQDTHFMLPSCKMAINHPHDSTKSPFFFVAPAKVVIGLYPEPASAVVPVARLIRRAISRTDSRAAVNQERHGLSSNPQAPGSLGHGKFQRLHVQTPEDLSGWGGSCISMGFLVVVKIVDLQRVPVLEPKDKPPVAAHVHGNTY